MLWSVMRAAGFDPSSTWFGINRFYCASSSSGLMRQALVQALHRTAHRSAFQKKLIQQP